MASSNKLTTPKDEMGFGPRDQQILPLPLFETTLGTLLSFNLYSLKIQLNIQLAVPNNFYSNSLGYLHRHQPEPSSTLLKFITLLRGTGTGKGDRAIVKSSCTSFGLTKEIVGNEQRSTIAIKYNSFYSRARLNNRQFTGMTFIHPQSGSTGT